MISALHQRLVYLLVIAHIMMQWWTVPNWVVVFGSVFVVWKWLADILSLPTPRGLWVPLLALLGSFGVYFEYDTLIQLEASSALLVIMLGLKTFEVRGYRDLMILSPLCFLLLMSRLLEVQSVMMTLTVFMDVGFVVFLLLQFNAPGGLGVLRFGAVFSMLIQALPLLIVMFVVFPRANWGLFLKKPESMNQTGFSDQLDPRGIAQLVQSDKIVFRAFFKDGVQPLVSTLYWRGTTLTEARGLNWLRREERPDVKTALKVPEPLKPREINSVRVLLDGAGSGAGWLFLLEWPTDVRFSAKARQGQLERFSDRSFRLGTMSLVQEDYEFRYDDRPSPEFWMSSEGQLAIALARGSSELDLWDPGSRTAKLVVSLQRRLGSLGTRDRVKALRDWFQRQNFSYTLEPTAVDTIDQFLFDVRSGFCAHYSASVAGLLRALGVPARVVVGFQGAEASLLGDYLIVRERDAHAWIEYWEVESKLWIRLDPTEWVAPERISLGAQSYYEQLDPEISASGAPSWVAKYFGDRAFRSLGRFWLLVDQLEMEWLRILVHYDMTAQRELLAQIGLPSWSQGWLLGAGTAMVALMMMAQSLYSRRRQRVRLSESEAMWLELQKWLSEHAAPRGKTEGPVEYATRLEAQFPETWDRVQDLYRGALLARYGAAGVEADSKAQTRRQMRISLRRARR